MTNVFDRLAPRLDAAIETFRGEDVRLVPMTGGRLSDARPDPSRAPATVVGRVDLTPVVERLFGARRSGRAVLGETQQAGAKIILKLTPAAVSSLPWSLVKGDRVERLARPADAPLVVAEPVVLDRRGGITVVLVSTSDGDVP